MRAPLGHVYRAVAPFAPEPPFRSEDLFRLDPELCPGLEEENAAIVTTSLRIPVSALDLARPLAKIGENELRTVHELIARAHKLDLGG